MPESDHVVYLIKEAAQEASELARLELELARREMRSELAAMKRAAVMLAVAAAAGTLGLSLVLALVAYVSREAVVGIAILAFAASVVTAFAGLRRVPKLPLDRTRQRLEVDAKDLKARIA